MEESREEERNNREERTNAQEIGCICNSVHFISPQRRTGAVDLGAHCADEVIGGREDRPLLAREREERVKGAPSAINELRARRRRHAVPESSEGFSGGVVADHGAVEIAHLRVCGEQVASGGVDGRGVRGDRWRKKR